jgi:hypothetical protein
MHHDATIATRVAYHIRGLPSGSWKWMLGGAAIACLVLWYLRSSTYEECMVAEMKGQSQAIYRLVDKVCSRRFKREVDVWKKVKFEFVDTEGLQAIIRQTPPDDEYIVTRAKFRFSTKPCDEAADKDFGELVMGTSRDGSEFRVPINTNTIGYPVCMKSGADKGRYR